MRWRTSAIAGSRAKCRAPERRARRICLVKAKNMPDAVDFALAATENKRLFVGGIPKRPTGADCKSAGLRLRWFESTSLHHIPVTTKRHGRGGFEPPKSVDRFGRIAGSDPERDAKAARPGGPKGRTPGAIHLPPPVSSAVPRCGSSSTVEPQPSKLMVRVRFPSPAPLNARWHSTTLDRPVVGARHRKVARKWLQGSRSSVGRALPW